MAEQIKKALWEVETTFTSGRGGTAFAENFNQCTFFNYDSNAPAYINNLPIPPAVVSGGNVYPTSFTVSLNSGEVNRTSYFFDFKGSTSANLWIVYSQYKNVGA